MQYSRHIGWAKLKGCPWKSTKGPFSVQTIDRSWKHRQTDTHRYTHRKASWDKTRLYNSSKHTLQSHKADKAVKAYKAVKADTNVDKAIWLVELQGLVYPTY